MILDDGYSTIISFSENPDVKLYEKSMKPPGFDGGGPIDTTTMRNNKLRTNAPKKLITTTAGNYTAAYDPMVYADLLDMINVKQQITITYPNGVTTTFWGWLNTVEPNEINEGEQPTVSVGFELSNTNAEGVETFPETIAGSGSGD